MVFNVWAKVMGLNDKTIQLLEQEDLNDYDTLRDVSEKDLCELRLTIGMRALLLRAVERCKSGEGGVDVTDDVNEDMDGKSLVLYEGTSTRMTDLLCEQ